MRSRRRRQREPAELQITSFMNLMVILVPFLLITAVFSRMAIIELNLPTTDNSPTAPDEPEFALEIIVRADHLEVGERNAGVFSVIPNIDGEPDVGSLTEKLKDVKATFPDELAVTLLLEANIEYDVLVQVMDATRSYKVDEPGEIERAELFPEISIGDAPILAAAK